MVDDIRGEALDLQLRKACQGTSLEKILEEAVPTVSQVSDLIHTAQYVVRLLKVVEREVYAYLMTVGRIMHVASERPKSEWEGSGYANFTEFQKKVLHGLASSGARFDYMNMYRELGGFELADFEGVPIENAKYVARISKAMKASPKQKKRMMELAKHEPAQFKASLEEEGMLAPGEAFSASFVMTGSQGKIAEWKEWLNREDGFDNFVDKALAAAAEFDSTGPVAVRARILLAKAAEEIKTNGGISEGLEAEIQQWYRESHPGEVIHVTEYSETQGPQ